MRKIFQVFAKVAEGIEVCISPKWYHHYSKRAEAEEVAAATRALGVQAEVVPGWPLECVEDMEPDWDADIEQSIKVLTQRITKRLEEIENKGFVDFSIFFHNLNCSVIVSGYNGINAKAHLLVESLDDEDDIDVLSDCSPRHKVIDVDENWYLREGLCIKLNIYWVARRLADAFFPLIWDAETILFTN